MTRITNPSFRLRDDLFYTAPTMLSTIKQHLGLIRGSFVKPKLKLSSYINKAEAQAPEAISRPHPGFTWGMLANDTLGDCVIAMMLHSIEDFHLDAGTPPPTFTDADAISLYSAITGYNPKDPSTDQGTDESAAMQAWEKGLVRTSDGLVHQIAGTVAVDATDLNECRVAISEFVALQIGIALPLSAQGQQEWQVVGNPQQDQASHAGSWGGHGIPYREYDPETFKCVTWGAELLLTTGFHGAYAEEAHVVVTKEMLSKTGVGPSGVQWGDLTSDLAKFTPAQ